MLFKVSSYTVRRGRKSYYSNYFYEIHLEVYCMNLNSFLKKSHP